VSGQAQQGIDIFGRDTASEEAYGLQCKVRSGRLTFSEIEAEIDEAEEFEPGIQHFMVVTTANRDAALQRRVRLLSQRRQEVGRFAVHVVAWDDLVSKLDEFPEIAFRFFPFLRGSQLGDNNDDFLANQALSPNPFAYRLSFALALLNEGRTFDAISISRVAEAVGAERVSDVSKYFEGKEEPPIQFMRSFAFKFGINPQWLIHGEDEAFYCAEPVVFSALDAIPFIEEGKPEEIFVVKSKSEHGETAIVVRLDDLRYVTMNGVWHVSRHVGGTGRSQMVDLCQLFLYILDKKLPCRGFALDEHVFEQVTNGEIYPGSAFDRHNASSDWWISLLDIEHREPGAAHYKKWHGQSFLDAQEILRQCVTPELKKRMSVAT
jgi:hypothetical protein